MWALESQITEHRLYLQCSFFNIWPPSWLGHERTFAMAVTSGNPSWEARFPWKNTRNPRTVGRITCEFTIACEPKIHFTWENTRKVNPRNAAGFLRGAFSVEKDKECDRITCKFTITLYPRRVLLETRFPWKKIRNLGESAGVSCKFTVTLKARRILPEKTHGMWGGGWYDTHFRWRTQGIGGVGHPWH